MKFLYTFLASLCFCSQIFAAPPTVSSFTPSSASTGMMVTISGTNFVGVSSVSFGGTPATSFTVVSITKITAVVANGTSGLIQVSTTGGTASRAGFTFVLTSGIITDFGGFWQSTGEIPNSKTVDSSHNLLAVTFNGTTFSTGVNNIILDNNSIQYTAGIFKALPVAGINGVTASGTSTYLALAKKVDGSATVAKTTAVASFSVKSVLTDGINGLDLGTGVTNLPKNAVLTFQISNIDPSKITDNEPDILLTQIAQPVSGNDVFSFIDNSGTLVGISITQDMTLLPRLGDYDLDLFNLTPGTPFNNATAYSAYATNTNREIRLVALRLSDFGINAGNVLQIKGLKIVPSGNSDYAFVAYNANAINLPPNVTQDSSTSNSTLCAGGTANLTVTTSAAGGGLLSYAWEESINNGVSWLPVYNGGNYSGAATNRLSVANPLNGYRYRVIVTEAGNINTGTSDEFIIVVNSPTAPTAVTVSGTSSTCLNSALQLTSAVTGGSNLTYQWQSNASGVYTDIAGAILNTYVPPVNQTGVISYKLRVSSGSGCSGSLTSSSTATVTVTGISSVAEASRCAVGSVTLSATSTSGTLDWYAADYGGASLASTTSYTTPVLNASKTYYVAAGGCTSALRVPVTATIYPATSGGTIAGGTTVSPGVNSTTLTLGNYIGSILKWQSSTDTFNTVINDIANTSSELILTNLTQDMQFRALVKSGSCAAALSSNAFIIVNGTLAINNGSFSASVENDNIIIRWQEDENQNISSYELERSSDGIFFTKQYVTASNGQRSSSYKWVDMKAPAGNNYYRIREIYNSGKITYSVIVKVFLKNNSGFTVYPNPVIDHILSVQLKNKPAGTYRTKILNSVGQMIYTGNISHTGGSLLHNLQLPVRASSGVYKLIITAPDNESNSYNIIIK